MSGYAKRIGSGVAAVALIAAGATTAVAGAQAARLPPKAIYVEVGGNGLGTSINLEQQLKYGLTGRIVIGMTGTRGEQTVITGIPMLGMIRGTGSHHLELGAGIGGARVSDVSDTCSVSGGWSWKCDKGWHYYLTTVMGYRYQRRDAGWLARVGYMPSHFPDRDLLAVWPMLGVSLGFGF